MMGNTTSFDKMKKTLILPPQQSFYEETAKRLVPSADSKDEPLPKLYAIGDIHVEYKENQKGLTELPDHPRDWLILAGDVSDSIEGLIWTIEVLKPKFAQLLWVPGNHDLWTESRGIYSEVRGEDRYQSLVKVCRERGVVTPEDPYVEWPFHKVGEKKIRIALMFLLYDYSFAPDEHVGREKAILWAQEAGVGANDEVKLFYNPHSSREEWCRFLLSRTEEKMKEVVEEGSVLVMANHWPLRRDIVRLGNIPRYSPWCGTRSTEDWHKKYNAIVCIHGHTHVRWCDVIDDVRFEEVSLGYPGHWTQSYGVEPYLRRIL